LEKSKIHELLFNKIKNRELKFRKIDAVSVFSTENTSGKSAFSFVSFLCAGKEIEN
jgi:hypothetical protein